MSVLMAGEKIYTVDEVAAIIRVRPRTVRKLITDGKLEAFQVSNIYRIRQSALDAFMRGQKQKEEN